jgi:hypothetical protein
MALTKRAIDAFRFDPEGPAQQVLFDGAGLPGFGVRVFPSGRRSFVLWYRNANGRKRLYSLAPYGSVTLSQARKLAATTLVSVRAGGDPAETRRQKRKAQTVRELAELYIERHSKRFKKSWKDDDRQLRIYVLPALGHRTIREVTRADIARLHASIGDRSAGKRLSEAQKKGRGARFRGGGQYEANRTLQMLSSMFN